MAEEDHGDSKVANDSNSANEEMDLKGFYRPPAEAEKQFAIYSPPSFEIDSFVRNTPNAVENGSSTENIDPKGSYSPEVKTAKAEPIVPVAEAAPVAPVAVAVPETPVATWRPYSGPVPEVPEVGDLLKAPPQAAAAPEQPPAGTTEGEAAPEAPIEPVADALPELEGVGAAKPPSMTTYRLAVMGALLGVVFVVLIMALSGLFSSAPAPFDLGTVRSDGVGLKGRLFTKWEDKKLEYRLSFEPTYPEQKEEFSYAVTDSPRPLSIGIQLLDSMGFALCTRNILLAYDPGKAAAASAAAGAGADPGKADGQSVPPSDLDRLRAAEAQREKGNDIFQNQTGSDGLVAALSAEGVIPCSKSAYEKATTWSFQPDFPSLAEQSELLKQSKVQQVTVEQKAVARKRKPVKAAAPLRFSIEGDDVIVDYDVSAGILEGSSGENFYIDKDASQATQAVWQNLPARIHYRCDATTGCTVTRDGSGVMVRARRRR
jgi:hypothetical protein